MDMDIEYNLHLKKITKLLEQIQSEDEESREMSALQLANIRDESTTGNLLDRLKIEDNADVKKIIIYALGEIGSKEAIDILSKYSKANESETRWVALEALGKICDVSASKILINSLKTEYDDCVRVVIVKSLANFRSEKVIKTLIFSANNDRDIFVKREAYISLNKLGFLNGENLITSVNVNIESKYSSCLEIATSDDINYVEKMNHESLDNFHDKEDEIPLFEGWRIENFNLYCSIKKKSSATVVLVNDRNVINNRYSESADGIGATSTLFSSLDKAINHIIVDPQHIVESVKVSNLEEDVEGSVIASVVVKFNNYKIRKICIHSNIIKACFYAYIQAIKAIYSYDDNFNKVGMNQTLCPMSNLLQNDILQQYNTGERDFTKKILREMNYLSKVNFSQIDLSLSDLSFSNLPGVNFHKARLINTILTKVVISEANLSQSLLCGAHLNDAILKSSNLSNADLTGANLTNANLSNADLTGANLTNANLSNADLTGVNLTNANLSNADLTGVNLTTATIDGANFSNANLSRGDLTGLDLNKDKVIFCNTILIDTKMPEITIKMYGSKRIERMIHLFNQFQSDRYEIYAVHSNTIGCWWNSDIGLKFRQSNKELRNKNIHVRRVFVVPEILAEPVYKLIEEQSKDGIEVRCLSEKSAQNIDNYDLNKNFLVCKNLSVKENSFTTMMLVDDKEEEKSGYISYKGDEIEVNKALFDMIWYFAKPCSEYLKYLEKV
jgi:uncharacterized protein YjbI with pentapeptide repeats